jgi:lipopolysaccharide transport system ATP-binding protein
MAGGYLSLRERMVNALKFEKNNVEDFWALKGVSFEVQPGESIGIIGRNGAGKSTLLKILSKITPPTSGKIVSRGRIASLLEVGTGFHPELTGRENIFFNGSLLGMKRKEIEAKFDEIVDFSGVEKFLDTPLKHFSSGMQLRLAFAVAAFLEPEILIIDEVLAVGDAEFQKKCLGKMEDVSKSGRTILFVSHNMGAIKNLCKRTIALNAGNILIDVDTQTAIDTYLSQNSITSDLVFKKPSNAPLWIEGVRINGKTNDVILDYGDKLLLEVTCRSSELTSAYLGFVISSTDGDSIICANNRYQKERVKLTSGNLSSIECDLGIPTLMEGKYNVSLYLGDESKDYHVIENAIQIIINERDVWGNGKTPPKGSARMWWPTEFRIMK